MRIFLLLLGAIPLLALGLDLYFKDRAQERDARLVATANRLLIEATAPSQAARTMEIRRIAEAAPGIWQVQGNLILEKDGQEERSAYSVEIEQRCSNLADDGCWRPQAVVIGEERLLNQELAAAAAPPEATPPETTLPAVQPSEAASQQTSVPETAADSPAVETEGHQAEDAEFSVAAATPQVGTAAPSGGAVPAETSEQAAATSVMPADSADAAPPASVETVEMSVEESLVWLIQDRLARLGYGEPGTLRPSGVFDTPTRAAIEAYQYAQGLSRDGRPSFELLDHIEAEMEQRWAQTATQPNAVPQGDAQEPPAQQVFTQQIAEEAEPAAPSAPAPQQAADAVAPAAPAVEAPAGQTATQPAETAAPSWDTANAGGGNTAALADLEQEIAPAAGNNAAGGSVSAAENDETLSNARGDAELQSSGSASAVSPAAVPQQARVPEPPETAAAEPLLADDGEPYDESLVFLIEDRLNRLGYDDPTPIALDGKLDSRTRLAIFDYQEKNGLLTNGEPTNELLRHMEATLTGRRSGATAGN